MRKEALRGVSGGRAFGRCRGDDDAEEVGVSRWRADPDGTLDKDPGVILRPGLIRYNELESLEGFVEKGGGSEYFDLKDDGLGLGALLDV